MRSIWIPFIAALLFIPLWGCAPAAVRDLNGERDGLRIFPPEVIGQSTGGRDIHAFSFVNGPRRLVFVGAIHGGYEGNTAFLALKAIEYFQVNPNMVPSGMTISIIPVANPDGFYDAPYDQTNVDRFFEKIGEGRIIATGSTDVERQGALDVLGPEDIPAEVLHVASGLPPGRFNGAGVDLNRNWDCNWGPTGKWRDQEVSAGSKYFSEPETQALLQFFGIEVEAEHSSTVDPAKRFDELPAAVVFWHSKAGAVYASGCPEDFANYEAFPPSRKLAEVYGTAADYKIEDNFDHYKNPETGETNYITGDAGDYLSTKGVPAVAVELTSQKEMEWEKNLNGILATIGFYAVEDFDTLEDDFLQTDMPLGPGTQFFFTQVGNMTRLDGELKVEPDTFHHTEAAQAVDLGIHGSNQNADVYSVIWGRVLTGSCNGHYSKETSGNNEDSQISSCYFAIESKGLNGEAICTTYAHLVADDALGSWEPGTILPRYTKLGTVHGHLHFSIVKDFTVDYRGVCVGTPVELGWTQDDIAIWSKKFTSDLQLPREVPDFASWNWADSANVCSNGVKIPSEFREAIPNLVCSTHRETCSFDFSQIGNQKRCVFDPDSEKLAIQTCRFDSQWVIATSEDATVTVSECPELQTESP